MPIVTSVTLVDTDIQVALSMSQAEHTLTHFLSHTCEVNYCELHFLGKESEATRVL